MYSVYFLSAVYCENIFNSENTIKTLWRSKFNGCINSQSYSLITIYLTNALILDIVSNLLLFKNSVGNSLVMYFKYLPK